MSAAVMDVGVAAAAKTSARVLHQTIKERRHYQAWVIFGRLGEVPVYNMASLYKHQTFL